MPGLLTIERSPTLFHPYAEEIHPWDGEYMEQFWLPLIGPTSFVIGRRLHLWLGSSPRATVPLGSLNFVVGVGSARFKQSLDRLAKHHLLTYSPAPGSAHVGLPAGVPSISTRGLERLPPALAAAHAPYVPTRTAPPLHSSV